MDSHKQHTKRKESEKAREKRLQKLRERYWSDREKFLLYNRQRYYLIRGMDIPECFKTYMVRPPPPEFDYETEPETPARVSKQKVPAPPAEKQNEPPPPPPKPETPPPVFCVTWK